MKRLLVVFIVSSVLISASLILPLASYNLATAAGCVEPMVSAGNNHTVGLKADGTLIATGYNHYDQCNISSWTDIIQVVAGASYTIGLKSNGSVNAVGFNGYGQCNVSSWTGIVQVASGGFHTVGLKSDGTVVAVGDNNYGQCNVSSWTNISQVAAGYRNTAGLKSDGTVVVVGDNYYGQCNVSSWTNISQVTMGGYGHIVGLRSNGSVIAMGDDYYGQCNVGSWSGIVQVAAGDGHTLGVRSNSSVVAIGCNDFGQCNVGTWTDIVQVTAEYGVSIGLRVAGSVVAVGDNTDGQCNVEAWDLPPCPVEVWVDDDYSLGYCGGHTWEYDAFNKIQDGIDAVSGSTVHVAEGTYYENIVLKDGVELLGAGSDTTIIDGMQNGSVVTAINCGNTTKLEGFTLTNGSGTDESFYRLGGGMYNYNASPTITNCIFRDNSVGHKTYVNGGGMYNDASSPTITNCIFQNNVAGTVGFSNGGGMYNNVSSPTITNCIFQNNAASSDYCESYGGGMANDKSSPIITNCVFWGNSANDGGGGVIHNSGCSPIITNCILWYDSPNEIANYGTGAPIVTYSNVQDGYSGEGNINSDPLFVNVSAGDFHLTVGSPCIDAGSNSAPSLPTLDYEGDPRILPVWGTVDMGTDEYIHPAPSCESWDVQYRIVGGQITMNYSPAGITPIKKIVPLSEEHGGYMTFKFCQEETNSSRLVVIPQDSWYMENITVENVMTGIDMNLSIRLDSDASGILYVDDNIGDVDISSDSVSGRTPVQIDTIGDGSTDAAGSMLIPMTLVGDFNTSVGQSGELPFGMIFTTGNTSNVVSIPENLKMDGATMTSDGVPFAEEGGVAPYAGTNGTITATGTGDCLGIRLVGIRIDFQFEMKLELEPVRTADVNCDGSINVLDMIRIGQHWGQTGSGSWIPEDVNSDGSINVLDMIVIGQNWTG